MINQGFMRIRITMLILILLILSASVTIFLDSVSSVDDEAPWWDTRWDYRKQIHLPVDTSDHTSIHKPVDVHVFFDEPCWGVNEYKHSIRVCCYSDHRYYELENQVYNLTFKTDGLISECNIVFLIPGVANGEEYYYVYYDDDEKPSSKYTDHVHVEDSYYFTKPVSDITAEATYYGVMDDGYCVYGVGQNGRFFDQYLSQVVVKQKKSTRVFDILNADTIASFAFTYATGTKDKDQVSSGESLVHKEVLIDGNLMVEFLIISESSDKTLRTTAVYRYYHSESDDKRIMVHVRHECFKDSMVHGEVNLDGRYCALLCFKSRSIASERLNFGVIMPYVHYPDEEGNVRELKLNTNPESTEREWVVSYLNDADIGDEAWLSYGLGKDGRSHGIIFSSSVNITRRGSDENDGLQVKIAQREYLNFLGTEVDYTAINIGRNSYEEGYSHDLKIPYNLVVEFDAELYTTETGGCQGIRRESSYFKDLIRQGSMGISPSFEQKQERYDLTVITYHASIYHMIPSLFNKTIIPTLSVELYSDDTLVSSSIIERSFLTRSTTVFHNITSGLYLVKIYKRIQNTSGFFIGLANVNLQNNLTIQVYCTWQRTIRLTFSDQQGNNLQDVKAILLNKQGLPVSKGVSNTDGVVTLTAPYNPKDGYHVEAYYHDFPVYSKNLINTVMKIDYNIRVDLYNITVEVRDSLGLPPGVEVSPVIIHGTGFNTTQIPGVRFKEGFYYFKDTPAGEYTIQLPYGDKIDSRIIRVPEDGWLILLRFNNTCKLSVTPFDRQGNPLRGGFFTVTLWRDNVKVYEYKDRNLTRSLPPGVYTVKLYKDNTLIGATDVRLYSDQSVKIVTTIQSPLPYILLSVAIVVVVVLILMVLSRRISVYGLIKGVVITILVLSLLQPWWSLSGGNKISQVQYSSKLYMQPVVMIESISMSGRDDYNVAVLPDIFIDALSKVSLLIYTACLLILVSVLLKRLRRRMHIVFTITSLLLLIILLTIFTYGLIKLTSISVGCMSGDGDLRFMIEDSEVNVSASWGLSIGYYMVVAASVLLLAVSIKEAYTLIKNRRR